MAYKIAHKALPTHKANDPDMKNQDKRFSDRKGQVSNNLLRLIVIWRILYILETDLHLLSPSCADRPLDESAQLKKYFLNFHQTYVVGIQKNSLNETVPTKTTT